MVDPIFKPEYGPVDRRAAYYQAIDFVSVLYDRTLSKSQRHMIPHVPHMFDKRIMTEMQSYYEAEFEVTSRHRIRQKNDMQTPFRSVASTPIL